MVVQHMYQWRLTGCCGKGVSLGKGEKECSSGMWLHVDDIAERGETVKKLQDIEEFLKSM